MRNISPIEDEEKARIGYCTRDMREFIMNCHSFQV